MLGLQRLACTEKLMDSDRMHVHGFQRIFNILLFYDKGRGQNYFPQESMHGSKRFPNGSTAKPTISTKFQVLNTWPIGHQVSVSALHELR